MHAPYRRVGRVKKVHGTTGEVVVALATGLSFNDVAGLHAWVVPPPERVRRYVLAEGRPTPKGVVVRLSGIDDAAAAHDLTGRWLLVRDEDLPRTADRADGLLGYVVVDTSRGEIGVVTDLIVTGANDVLVVDDGPYGQVLVPVIDDVMLEVDDDAMTVRVSLLDGLIEEDPGS